MSRTTTHAVNVLGTSREQEFAVTSRLERFRILRELEERREPITAYIKGTGQFFLTIVIDVDKDKNLLVLDYAQDNAMNGLALKNGTLVCATALNRVKIEFALDKLVRSQKPENAFMAPLPASMIRLQRRKFFRVTIPFSLPVKCAIAKNDQLLELALFDISLGGVSVDVVGAAEGIMPGVIFRDCVITFPDAPPLHIDMEVRNRHQVSSEKSREVWRIGFSFVDVPPPITTVVQRHIFDLEREQMLKKKQVDD